MKYFREFLDNIASPGGNLLILCFFVLATGWAMAQLRHGNEASNERVDTVMISVFSGFTGALLQALTAIHRTERIERIETRTATEEAKPHA